VMVGWPAWSLESQPISCVDFVFDSAGIAHTHMHAAQPLAITAGSHLHL
jgi:hypothetical protein